jgi:hypothetical protein
MSPLGLGLAKELLEVRNVVALVPGLEAGDLNLTSGLGLASLGYSAPQ